MLVITGIAVYSQHDGQCLSEALLVSAAHAADRKYHRPCTILAQQTSLKLAVVAWFWAGAVGISIPASSCDWHAAH